MAKQISDLIKNDMRESMHVLIIDEFLQQNAGRAVQQPRVFTHLTVHTNLKSQYHI